MNAEIFSKSELQVIRHLLSLAPMAKFHKRHYDAYKALIERGICKNNEQSIMSYILPNGKLVQNGAYQFFCSVFQAEQLKFAVETDRPIYHQVLMWTYTHKDYRSESEDGLCILYFGENGTTLGPICTMPQKTYEFRLKNAQEMHSQAIQKTILEFNDKGYAPVLSVDDDFFKFVDADSVRIASAHGKSYYYDKNRVFPIEFGFTENPHFKDEAGNVVSLQNILHDNHHEGSHFLVEVFSILTKTQIGETAFIHTSHFERIS